MLLKAVEAAFDRLAPRSLSGSWDNVGPLIRVAPKPISTTVVLTIDLTAAVLDALPPDTGVIVAYHPPIFRGLKALDHQIPLQSCLLRCIQQNIAVYTPHSSLDGAQNGINDFLAAGLGAGSCSRLKPTPVEGHPDAGEGLLLTLDQSISNEELANRVKKHLGLHTVMLAKSAPSIKTIAICAGSGGGMLSGVKADAYFTGEMQHHDILAAKASGTSVVLCCHSNTERPFLKTFAPRFLEALQQYREEQGAAAAAEGAPEWKVVVSDADAEPLEFV